MFELTNHDHVRIYTDTLLALARDAAKLGNVEAFRFLTGYMQGLIPQSQLDQFLATVAARAPRPAPRDDKPDPNVPRPVTPPRGSGPATVDPFKLPSW